MDPTFWNEFSSAIMPIAASVAAGAVIWGVKAAVGYLVSRTDNEKLQRAITELGAAVWTSVGNLEQTVRPMLSDGKLSDTEKLELRDTALQMVKERVSPATIAIAERELTNLDTWIKEQIEATVFAVNRNQM